MSCTFCELSQGSSQFVLTVVASAKGSVVRSDMFCAGRVPEEDLRRTQRACGGAVLSSVRELAAAALGRCSRFTERQVGGERYNIFTGQ